MYMKKIARMILLASVIYSTACVPSINSFCTEEDAYLDVNLLGTWSDPDGLETWSFAKKDDGEYLLTYMDENGRTGVFTARQFKLGDRSFLDISPTRSASKQNSFYDEHFLSMHSVYLLSISGKTGRIAFMDPAWLRLALKKDPDAVGHAVVDGEIVLTDTTERLKTFLVANANTPDAFVTSEPLERKK